MTDAVVVEGHVRWRDGKKWKSRWLVLRKPSPVADCLLMLVYKDKSERVKGHKERSSVTLEDICGLDPGLSYEGLNHTLAIICLSQVVMLGFENKETMYAWDVRIRYSLGEVHRFHVSVAPGTKLESGPATLHFCNDILVLVKDVPPTVMGQWKLSDLRRYGAVPNGFIFEGGTRCGFWAGVFFLSCAEGEQISFLFDCIVRGISPTKGPFGLRPVLPDPSTNPTYSEEKLVHEALQLEKRLSLLSHTSRQGSGGDDRSLSSSSSDTSHSDVSVGSRWSDVKPQGQVSDSKGSELAPPSGVPADPCEIYSPHPGMARALFSACPICGGLKGTSLLQSGVLPAIPGASSVMAASAALKVHKGHPLQAGLRSGYELMALPAEVGIPSGIEEPGGAVGYSTDLSASDRPRSEMATYVNIPVSPTSKKQLHYMELELQEPSPGIRGSGATRYAQIDIAATETAHKVGTQHAQFREERLQELEQKKKGGQQ
ncbi:protein Dok-7 isoform A [Alligator mississippiensis]|uniref:Protein Dok-7 isoform A n=1 Tax=Alligator mississippiensis TaxID=8496 RepID=A0A151P9H6_ALLMI|nr:protein Dok-7 isoform A [Alligator mississippiensis]